MSDGEGLQFLCLILLIVAIVLLVFLCIRLNSIKVEQTKVEQTKVEQTLVSDEQLDKLLGVITPYTSLFNKLDKMLSLYTDCCFLRPLWCFIK
jgi:uncharacterized protein YpmS